MRHRHDFEEILSRVVEDPLDGLIDGHASFAPQKLDATPGDGRHGGDDAAEDTEDAEG